MTRSTTRDVVFRHPFRLEGMDRAQPAGSYTVETVEVLMDTMSSYVYRRVETSIRLPSRPGVMESFVISGDELDRALRDDAAT